MTNVLQLREEIARIAAETHQDRLAEVASDGLVMAFDKVVPRVMAIRGAASIALSVQPGIGRLTSRQSAQTQERFARAVASIGHEISRPREPTTRLTQADYARAPIFTTTTPAGLLVFTPARGALVAEDETESLSERAMSRLADLLPARDQDDLLQERLLSLRVPSARAVHEVAMVAKSVGGLELSLVTTDDETHVTSVVTYDQADWIEDFLDDQSESVVRQRVKGRLDGMRYKRRMFYLEADGGAEFSGTIDESLVDRVSHLVNEPVNAVLEKVTRTSRAGIEQRPTYRLVGVSEQDLKML